METKKINGKAVVSLILSCLSVLCCFAWYLAIIVGMIGVVLGIIAYRESEGGQRDLAIAGIIVGAVGMSLGIVSAVLYIMLTSGPRQPSDDTGIPICDRGAISKPGTISISGGRQWFNDVCIAQTVDVVLK